MDHDIERAPSTSLGSPFLTTLGAAVYLDMPERTLAQMRTSETGPRFRRHGRKTLYHIDDLDRWSEQQVQPARCMPDA